MSLCPWEGPFTPNFELGLVVYLLWWLSQTKKLANGKVVVVV